MKTQRPKRVSEMGWAIIHPVMGICAFRQWRANMIAELDTWPNPKAFRLARVRISEVAKNKGKRNK